MRLKVISGGQTGADKTALEVAYSLGIDTGGYCPLGCRTDEGPDFELIYKYKLRETQSSGYNHRTEMNIIYSDLTLWFGNVYSPGGKLTSKLCEEHGRLFIPNAGIGYLIALFDDLRPEVINVAGNRRRTNPYVVDRTRNTLTPVLKEYMMRVDVETIMREALERVC